MNKKISDKFWNIDVISRKIIGRTVKKYFEASNIFLLLQPLIRTTDLR
jgi:hypothetical protein